MNFINYEQPKNSRKGANRSSNSSTGHAYHIINYSNATPFKTNNGSLRCSYGCPDDDFTPDILREHVQTLHLPERLAVITGAPSSVIKIDVKNLTCLLCNTRVNSLNEFEDHLFSTHNMRFERTLRDIIVPFELSDSTYKCQMCDESFSDLRQVSKHMHRHFSYHSCGVCGEGFMTKEYLKWHREVHRKDDWPCIVCGKLFDSLAKRRRHFESMHNNAAVYSCPLCPLRFKENYLKTRHLAEVHQTVPDKFICGQCNKSFTTKANLNLHERRSHKMERNHKCDYCEKTFFLSARLKDHMTTHTGEKCFVCGICFKAYGTQRSLTKHCKSHKQTITVKQEPVEN